MKQHFAFSRADNTFIVNAETRQALEDKINSIREKHPGYYMKHVQPGYYVVEARSMAEAKKAKKDLSFDLPLFKQSPTSYQVYRLVDTELTYSCTFHTLDEALNFFRNHPEDHGEIRSLTEAGETLKTYQMKDIQHELVRLHREMLLKRKQLNLF